MNVELPRDALEVSGLTKLFREPSEEVLRARERLSHSVEVLKLLLLEFGRLFERVRDLRHLVDSADLVVRLPHGLEIIRSQALPQHSFAGAGCHANCHRGIL